MVMAIPPPEEEKEENRKSNDCKTCNSPPELLPLDYYPTGGGKVFERMIARAGMLAMR